MENEIIGDIENIFFTEETLKAAVKRLGDLITLDYAGKKPILIGVLKGSFMFMADLVRTINLSCEVDFVALSSYGGGTSTSGKVVMNKDLDRDITGRDVIIIEDILDSGVTLSFLKKHLLNRNANSIKICALLDKSSRRIADIKADYVGFECPDAFIVGYGLDYAEKYRNLPFIGVLKPEIYS